MSSDGEQEDNHQYEEQIINFEENEYDFLFLN
jgi:hypothetical protein